MKKVFLAAAVLATIGFTSCKKDCVDCDCGSGVTGFSSQELCEDDFANESQYNQAVDTYEAGGCDCS